MPPKRKRDNQDVADGSRSTTRRTRAQLQEQDEWPQMTSDEHARELFEAHKQRARLPEADKLSIFARTPPDVLMCIFDKMFENFTSNTIYVQWKKNPYAFRVAKVDMTPTGGFAVPVFVKADQDTFSRFLDQRFAHPFVSQYFARMVYNRFRVVIPAERFLEFAHKDPLSGLVDAGKLIKKLSIYFKAVDGIESARFSPQMNIEDFYMPPGWQIGNPTTAPRRASRQAPSGYAARRAELVKIFKYITSECPIDRDRSVDEPAGLHIYLRILRFRNPVNKCGEGNRWIPVSNFDWRAVWPCLSVLYHQQKVPMTTIVQGVFRKPAIGNRPDPYGLQFYPMHNVALGADLENAFSDFQNAFLFQGKLLSMAVMNSLGQELRQAERQLYLALRFIGTPLLAGAVLTGREQAARNRELSKKNLQRRAWYKRDCE